jgi:hypothetical protein
VGSAQAGAAADTLATALAEMVAPKLQSCGVDFAFGLL